MNAQEREVMQQALAVLDAGSEMRLCYNSPLHYALRAALTAPEPEPAGCQHRSDASTEAIRSISTMKPAPAAPADVVRVCPTFDRDCGDRKAAWCLGCPKHKAVPEPDKESLTAAPSGALPPLPGASFGGAFPYSAEDMHAYARAALAAQRDALKAEK